MRQTFYSSVQNSPADARENGKMKSRLQQMFPWNRSDDKMDVSSVIETAFLFPEADCDECQRSDRSDISAHSSTDSELSVRPCMLHSYGTFGEEVLDEEECHEVCTLLRSHLLEAQFNHLGCNLLVPRNLLSKISEDIVRMSHCEPCGLRGCVIYVTVVKGERSVRCGKIRCDENTVATFELHLTLKEDTKHWFSLRDLISQLVAGCSPGALRDEIYISPGFQLEKKKLYRPN